MKKRYKTENKIMKKLKVDSLAELSKDKMVEFASIIPYVDSEVAKEIINQFPEYVQFGKTIVEYYSNTCKEILKNNSESYQRAVEAQEKVLDVLAKRLEEDNIDNIEKQDITRQMMEVADKICDMHEENQKFYIVILGGLAAIVSVVLGNRN